MTLLRFIHVKYCYIAGSMTEKMLKFVNINQKNPSKRNEIERKKDFDEIYAEFINENANKQSSTIHHDEHCLHAFV